MKLIKYKIGNLIAPSFEVNSNLRFGENDVRGMTITKEIIPTKANMEGTALDRFIVVCPDDFIYNPRTHGKKIGLGYNNTQDSFIISWNNTAFRILPEAKKLIVPEYLFMHFNRDEWDREACYRSWGSSTEVFSWDALCEMQIILPPVDIQQKYVDIYHAMEANQRVYLSGLNDLKLTCDAYLEKLMLTLPHKPIGEYIELCDEKNGTMELGIGELKGISVNKVFIESKADMSGVSLKPYLLVEPDAFAYVTITSRNGEKISLAHNDAKDTYIVSSSYVVFRVKQKEKLIARYLNIYFNRSEFDRYTRFNSWGSAREAFSWDDMCEVKIPIPETEIQQSIVNIYNAYTTRRSINEKLKAHIKDICPLLIKGSLEEAARD